MLDEAKGKTRNQLEEMIARRFPRPDAPTVEMPTRTEPLSANGVRVQMTMTAQGYADLKRAKELLGHCVPDGDTVKVIERALRTLIEQLEKDRRAKTSRPRASARPSRRGHISAATRREVFARDGEQCTYLDAEGRRCACRTQLELDHIQPCALGGSDEASNLRVRCRAHNRRAAEEIFGKEHVATRIHCRQRRQKRSEARSPVFSETMEQARRGLVNMGFARSDVKKTLVSLAVHHRDAASPPLLTLLRDAIAALT